MEFLPYVLDCAITIAILVAINYLLGEELTTIITIGLFCAPFIILGGALIIAIIIWVLSCMGDE